MRRVEHALDVPASHGPGEPQRCDTYVEKWVEVYGTYTGTCSVEGQFTAAGPWIAVGLPVTGGVSSGVEVKPLFTNVRLNTTSVSTGAPVANLVALDARTAA